MQYEAGSDSEDDALADKNGNIEVRNPEIRQFYIA